MVLQELIVIEEEKGSSHGWIEKMIKKKYNIGKDNPMYGKVGYWAGKKRPEISEKMKGIPLSEIHKENI